MGEMDELYERVLIKEVACDNNSMGEAVPIVQAEAVFSLWIPRFSPG
jgi:hypothetical protein